MVLEETLVLYNRDEAREVAGALRKGGMPIRTVRKDILIRSIAVIGRIRDVKAAIEERIARGEEDDDARPWLKRVLASLQEEEDAVADFLQQHSPGETVTAIMQKKSLPDLYQSLRMEGTDVEEAKRVVAEYLKNRKVFMLLARSGQIQVTDDGEATLQGHPEPGDLVTKLSGEIIDEVGLKTLKKHAVRTSMAITSAPEFHLEFSAEAIGMLQLPDLDDLVNETDIDPEIYDTFRDSVYAKWTVASRVMALLKGRGTVPAGEIFALLQGDAFDIPGRIEEVTLELDIDFVQGLLDDMRKIGIIRRKGAGYRLA